jgi:hypothetical protein
MAMDGMPFGQDPKSGIKNLHKIYTEEKILK